MSVRNTLAYFALPSLAKKNALEHTSMVLMLKMVFSVTDSEEK
jgi:hypothetical protein